MTKLMDEYRCTRPDVYTSDCPGRTNPAARQGHYEQAESLHHAAFRMKAIFPDDTCFDVELWKDGEGQRVRDAERKLERVVVRAFSEDPIPLPIQVAESADAAS